jgi:hypothetical protein
MSQYRNHPYRRNQVFPKAVQNQENGFNIIQSNLRNTHHPGVAPVGQRVNVQRHQNLSPNLGGELYHPNITINPQQKTENFLVQSGTTNMDYPNFPQRFTNKNFYVQLETTGNEFHHPAKTNSVDSYHISLLLNVVEPLYLSVIPLLPGDKVPAGDSVLRTLSIWLHLNIPSNDKMATSSNSFMLHYLAKKQEELLLGKLADFIFIIGMFNFPISQKNALTKSCSERP